MSVDKEQYRELIRQLVPINEFSLQRQNEVIESANIIEYKKKQFVFQQGDKDGYSFYLLDGEIELLSGKNVQSTIVSGTDTALYPMAQLQPRQYSAKAKKAVTILQLNRGSLDRLMILAEKEKTDELLSGDSEMEVSDIGEEDSGDWMTTMLQSELFSRLPTANIHQLFALLEEVEVKAGDTIIRQGDVGDQYYIIQSGRCEVTRSPSEGAKAIKLAELSAGDSFGEEALLTEAKRNASIKMLTDGLLMQLSKENFINLIKKPTLGSITYEKAKEMVNTGAVWLDVRYQNEHNDNHIEGSINIPLNVLRMQADKLESDKQYVIYCDTGGRSSAATFLLAQRGFNVSYLKDGLVSVPQLAIKEKETEKPEEKAEAKEKPEEKVEAKEKQEEKVDESTMEPSVRASVLEADLAKTNKDLETVKKQAETNDTTGSKEQKVIEKKLEQEKKKIEAEKLAAEKEARKRSEQEALKIKKLKEEAEKRLQEEKKQLEAVYERNTKEMEKLQRMKKEAEEQIRREREKLERDAAAAKAKLEKAAEEKLKQQEAMEKQLQAKAKAKLEEERRKLADAMAKSNEEMERAQQEKAAADAARKAAEQEAKKIIEEYKQQVDSERAAEEDRIKEERKKLEEESNKIQEMLKEINLAKQGAEATRQAAEEEAKKLRALQNQQATTQDNVSPQVLDKEIKDAESKLAQARKIVEDAEKAEHKIVEAKVVNERDLKRQKEIEEMMRATVAEDLALFMEEHKEKEDTKEVKVSHEEHARRIKESAEKAKNEAEKATDDLFADIASQLGSK